MKIIDKVDSSKCSEIVLTCGEGPCYLYGVVTCTIVQQILCQNIVILMGIQASKMIKCLKCRFRNGFNLETDWLRWLAKGCLTVNSVWALLHTSLHYWQQFVKIRIRMSFIDQVCLHIPGMCYSDRSSTVQQNDSERTEHRQQKNNVQNGRNTIQTIMWEVWYVQIWNEKKSMRGE